MNNSRISIFLVIILGMLLSTAWAQVGVGREWNIEHMYYLHSISEGSADVPLSQADLDRDGTGGDISEGDTIVLTFNRSVLSYRPVTIDVKDITITGQQAKSEHEVILEVEEGFKVQADGVELKNFTITGRTEGVQLRDVSMNVSPPEDANVAPSDLTLISSGEGETSIGSGGTADTTIIDTDTQLALVQNQQGNNFMLGYVFAGEATQATATSAQLSNYTASASQQINVNAESTALSLVMLQPILGGAPTQAKTDLAQAAQSHQDFPSLVESVKKAIVDDSTSPLDRDNEEIYRDANVIANDIIESGPTAAIRQLAQTNSSDNNITHPSGGPEIGSELTSSGKIKLINDTAVFYGVHIDELSNSENDYVSGIEDFLFRREWNWLQVPPGLGEETDNTYLWESNWSDNVRVRFDKIETSTNLDSWDNSDISATAANSGTAFFYAVDLALGVGDVTDTFSPRIIDTLWAATQDFYSGYNFGEAVATGDAVGAIESVLSFAMNNGEEVGTILGEIVRNYSSTEAAETLIQNSVPVLKVALTAVSAVEQTPFWYGLISDPNEVELRIHNDNGSLEKADFSPTPKFSCNINGLTLDCDASNSTDNGSLEQYDWWIDEWGGDDFSFLPDKSGETITHTVANPGFYWVTLRVTDNEGNSSKTPKLYDLKRIQDSPPEASFTVGYPEGDTAPVNVEFDASSSTDDNGIVSYNWGFGDGGTFSSSSPTTSHLYGSGGTYNVTLQVKDSSGQTDTAQKEITLQGGAENDIRVTLTWNKKVDMDLHITTSSGNQIDYNHTQGNNGGGLDHDIIYPGDSQWEAPYQENITWEPGEAVDGIYQVGVNYYAARSESGPTEVRVAVRVHEGSDNEVIKRYGPYTIDHSDGNNGDSGAWWKVIEFDYPEANFRDVSGSIPLGMSSEEPSPSEKSKKEGGKDASN